jgi:hypothetical protein
MKAKKPINQNLSKDMKKQGHVSNRKPSNKKLSSEKELAETPKKGQYREPSSKKLSSETSLTKSKLTHIKEFNEFDDEKHWSEEEEFNDEDDIKIKVKDIIEYLQEYDPETLVYLDKNGWEGETKKEMIDILFWKRPEDNYIIVNN